MHKKYIWNTIYNRKMCECYKKCECKGLCCAVSGFKYHSPGSGGILEICYYAHHFDVGAVNDIYHLPMGMSEGQVLKLRLRSTTGGQLQIDVDNLSGNMSQVQLTVGSSWAELHWRCCQWHLADHDGATCT